MTVAQQILTIVYIVIIAITTALAIYQTILGLAALFGRKQKYPMIEDKLKFCVFVPCHNEEDVIAATVGNFAKFRYNPDLFDVYFIADNCADDTAGRVRQTIEKLGLSNFYALERNVDAPDKKGKPHAINWALNTLEETSGFYDKYDMFMILDADNFADADILKHINSQYFNYREDKRPVMIQTYLDSKNKKGIIARGYFASYRVINAMYQMARHNLGLTPAIGGTGFACDVKFLKEIGGFSCKSLVEDLEIQAIATLKGRRIAHNHNARIYDEKPTGLKQSFVQKTRWAQGTWWIFFHYGWKLFFRMFNPKEWRFFWKRFDCITHFATMVLMLFSILTAVFSGVFMICGWQIPDILPWFSVNIGGFALNILTTVMGVYTVVMFMLASLYDGPAKEKKWAWLTFIPDFIVSSIYNTIYAFAAVVGLFKCGNQKVWRKTKHSITVMAEDIVQEEQEETSAQQE